MREHGLYILYYDIFYYFSHRLLHTRLLYPIHKIHHKNINTSFYDYYKVHILEFPLTSVGLFIAVYLYKLYIYQFICCVFFINIRGMVSHDPKFIYYVGDHHLLHHRYYKCNYGEKWLDFIFGTMCNKK
jgi:sterol desaturase/sphingolipid hydroxylase (fatty acid hydroxylase superfamily)